MKSPLRLLMTADTIGGVWTYALELARTLAQHNVQIALATMGRPLANEQHREIRAIPNLELFESAYKLEWMEDPWMDVVAAGEWLLELERRVTPDIVHLNGFAYGALPWRAPKIVVAHSCVLSWWRAVHGADASKAWGGYREAVTAGLRAADLVVAPSDAMLKNVVEHYGSLQASIVIPNGRKLSPVPAVPKEQFVLAAGRLWDAAKNISALAAVAPRLPWPVYVAGEEQSPDGFQAQHQHVRHLGRLPGDGLLPWLARASIYALPARYEPFGLSALEAALAGCALVLGDIPSLREIWGDTALFVAPDDPEGLARTLKNIMAQPTLLAELGAKARCAASRYTPELMGARYLAAYNEAEQRFLGKEQLAGRRSGSDLIPEAGKGADSVLGTPALAGMASGKNAPPPGVASGAHQDGRGQPQTSKPELPKSHSSRATSRLSFRRRLPVNALEEIVPCES